jgi:hypothetical protein
MNANTTTRLLTRSAAAAACLGAVLVGAAACGNDDGTTTASPQLGHQGANGVGATATASTDPADKSKGDVWAYMYKPEPQRSHPAVRVHSGDDRRQHHG